MDLVTESESSSDISWVTYYCTLPGNDFFCEINPSYLKDKFNFSGLDEVVFNFEEAFYTINDMKYEPDTDSYDEVQTAAKFLYGLIHARFIMTDQGVNKMVQKYEFAEFGICPRLYCGGQAVLPVGMTDSPGEDNVKLFCPKCVDVFNPKSTRYHDVDGAYFGTSFPHMLFMVHPELRPQISTEKYKPKI